MVSLRTCSVATLALLCALPATAAITRTTALDEYETPITYTTYRVSSRPLSELLKSYGASGLLALLTAYAAQGLEKWLEGVPTTSPTEVLQHPRKEAAKWLSVPVIMKLAPLGMIKVGSEVLRALGIDPSDEFTSYTLEQAFELMLQTP